jgi:hypothetical protein
VDDMDNGQQTTYKGQRTTDDNNNNVGEKPNNKTGQPDMADGCNVAKLERAPLKMIGG